MDMQAQQQQHEELLRDKAKVARISKMTLKAAETANAAAAKAAGKRMGAQMLEKKSKRCKSLTELAKHW